MNLPGNIDQRTWELLNAALDGELSPLEEEELREILAVSDTASALHREMAALTGLLDGLGEVEPPVHLQESIERQVRLPPQDKAPGEKPALYGGWLPAHWIRTGLALAAGVVLTIGVYEMGSEPLSEKDSNKLVGTVVKSELTVQGELLDRVVVSNSALNGIVEWRKYDDVFTLDVQLDSDGPAELVLDFAGRGFEFEGIEQLLGSNGAMAVTEGAISVSGGGKQHYKLKLQRNLDTLGQQTASLGLQLFADTSLVQEAELGFSQQ